MDRFIGNFDTLSELDKLDLKSSMDRFIAASVASSTSLAPI